MRFCTAPSTAPSTHALHTPPPQPRPHARPRSGLAILSSHFTLREATVCFALSRTHVIDESVDTSRRKMESLCFEDFVECIIRASLEMPFPTDAEIQHANFADAGASCPLLEPVPATDANH